MTPFGPEDLEPDERRLHRLLSAVPPQALPLGFRDTVMRRVTERRTTGWEWIVAGVLAVPSLAFLVAQLAIHGADFAAAANNVMSAAATADTADAFFFVDGATVLALAMLGIASLIAAHASFAAPAQSTTSR